MPSLCLRTKLDEPSLFVRYRTDLHRVWFGGRTKDQRDYNEGDVKIINYKKVAFSCNYGK